MVTVRHASRRQNGANRARHASPRAVTRNHESRETWFGHVPDGADRQTIPRPVAPGRVGITTPGPPKMHWFAIVIAALRQRCLRLLPLGWRIPRRREVSDERVIASFGSVTIRRMPAALFVGTCVHGEPAQARDKALQRLTDYLNGDNHLGVVPQAELPVIQQQLGPQLWRFSVRLQLRPADAIAPPPRAPKVKLWSTQPECMAVVRMHGRPAYGAVSSGDAMVLNAIASTDWTATGAAMTRLYAAGPVRWFRAGFEVVVPVVSRCRNDVQYNAAASVGERLPAD